MAMEMIDAQERYAILQFCKENFAGYTEEQVQIYQKALLAVALAVENLQQKEMSADVKFEAVKHGLGLMFAATQVELKSR